MAENGQFRTPFLTPKIRPKKFMFMSLFCVLSQEMRHINFFSGGQNGVFWVGGHKVYVEKVYVLFRSLSILRNLASVLDSSALRASCKFLRFPAMYASKAAFFCRKAHFRSSQSITGSLVTLENLFPRNYCYRYRLETRMNSFNCHCRCRFGVCSHPFISIDSQLSS